MVGEDGGQLYTEVLHRTYGGERQAVGMLGEIFSEGGRDVADDGIRAVSTHLIGGGTTIACGAAGTE